MLIAFGEIQGIVVHLMAGRQLPLGEHLPICSLAGRIGWYHGKRLTG